MKDCLTVLNNHYESVKSSFEDLKKEEYLSNYIFHFTIYDSSMDKLFTETMWGKSMLCQLASVVNPPEGFVSKKDILIWVSVYDKPEPYTLITLDENDRESFQIYEDTIRCPYYFPHEVDEVRVSESWIERLPTIQEVPIRSILSWEKNGGESLPKENAIGA